MSSVKVIFGILVLIAAASANVIPSIDFSQFNEWSGRIVGGSPAGSGQFPHQVSLRSTGNAHFCGGTVLNLRWVLSAAHCTIGRSPAATRIIVGTHQLNSGGSNLACISIINHPQYNANTLANDISLLQSGSNIPSNNLVSTIALGQNFIGGGVTSTISGWGQTSHPGSIPNTLQFFHTSTLTNADCQSRHTVGNRQFITGTNICTFTRAGQGNCMGDSGGPLISGGTVIGVVSWGIACAVGSPDVYARVSSYRNWALNIIS